MNIEVNETFTFKLVSGEELIARVKKIEENFILVEEPVSVAPGPQGMGLIPSLFTSESHSLVRINTNCITMIATTENNVKMKYTEATGQIAVPSKKIVLG